MATVSPDQLAERIQKILEEYETEVEQGTVECVKAVAKEGVKALKANSPRRTGEYANGWTSTIESTRLTASATLHNKKPGLPHLLEFGHVIRNGTGRTFGRVAARPHIAAIEEVLVKNFGQRIKVELEK